MCAIFETPQAAPSKGFPSTREPPQPHLEPKSPHQEEPRQLLQENKESNHSSLPCLRVSGRVGTRQQRKMFQMSSHFSELIFFTALVEKWNLGAEQKHSTRPAAGSEGHEQHRDISIHKMKNVTKHLFFICLLCLIFKMNQI